MYEFMHRLTKFKIACVQQIYMHKITRKIINVHKKLPPKLGMDKTKFLQKIVRRVFVHFRKRRIFLNIISYNFLFNQHGGHGHLITLYQQ